jgi:aryl-phospho-beta-D-glucosidase BglC (GH1 family)
MEPGPEDTATHNFAPGLPPQLLKGINLSNWFNDFSDPAQFGTRFTPLHFSTIKALGFTYVRLPVGITILFNPAQPAVLHPGNLPFIDSAIRRALEAGLAVVINLHPLQEDYEKALFQNTMRVSELIAYWKALAGYLKKYNPQQIFFEVYNEPHVGNFIGPANEGWKWWWPVQQQIVQALRPTVPKHYIIAGAEGWNSIRYLIANDPYTTPGVVYNFHFYAPFFFTHQSAGWVDAPVNQFRDVPYPSSPERLQPLLDTTTNNEAKDLLTWYGNLRFNRDTLQKQISQAAAWAAQYGVPLTCNEFGVYKPYAPRADRLQWIEDVRTILEEHGIGWAMWELDEGFGLLHYSVTDRNQFEVDAAVVRALGL